MSRHSGIATTRTPNWRDSRFVLSVALVLSGCHGATDSGAYGHVGPTYSVSGTVSGLTGSGLTLSINGANVSVASNATTVTLASGLSPGVAYAVSVQTQPSGQTCSVAAGTGTITSANVANVVVTCANQAFNLGGLVSGLNGSGLVDRKSTRLNSSHQVQSRMPSSA